jgi:hypothetical protein
MKASLRRQRPEVRILLGAPALPLGNGLTGNSILVDSRRSVPEHPVNLRSIPVQAESTSQSAQPESPLERAKRRSREMVSVDSLLGITERVPWTSRDYAPPPEMFTQGEG